MDQNELTDALEILRSGTLKGQTLVVTNEQRRALRAAIDDLDEVHEALAYRPAAASPAAHMFSVRG